MPRLCLSTSGANALESPWRTSATSASSGTPASIVEPPDMLELPVIRRKSFGTAPANPAPMSKAGKSPALAPKPVSASATTLATLMEPADANPMGNVHGGAIMKLVDQAAAAAAIRHSGRICVTVAVDRLDFFGPVHGGRKARA